MKQEQFLDVVDERTARARFDAACAALSTSSERVALAAALGRVLAEDVASPVDVPGFDRSDVDGFAVQAEDTFGAEELAPRRLRVASVRLAAGATPPADLEVRPGEAVQIATGAVVPRGADAVVMVEHTRTCSGDGGAGGAEAINVPHAVAPGGHVSFAGSDLGRGEIVLRSRTFLTSRETAMLAAIGVGEVAVLRRPVVGVLSTGDEIRAPGTPLPLAVGALFDSNQRAIADAAREQGCDVRELGILPDDVAALRDRIRSIVVARSCDVLLLSGGTSKGAGDLNYRVVADLAAELAAAGRADSPGIVVHGVALKPGKPLCLAVVAGVPVVILPGFPTSAIFTFHEFVAPLLRRLAGRRDDAQTIVRATLPLRIQSAVGRTDYQLVNLIEGAKGLTAYPLGAGSGSVSAFARADGFLRVPQEVEVVAEGTEVEVRILGSGGRGGRAADLVAIGSHCIGLDRLLSVLAARGLAVKSIAVGSQGGLSALARGEGDVAGTHLLDAATGVYNRAFLPPGTRLLPGYARRQGLVFRRGDPRFEGADIATFLARAVQGGVRMIHRNKGSGTRVLLDGLLAAHAPGAVPDGFAHQAKSHHAVAAAVAQGRADWGMTLDTLAAASGLGFLFVRDESFDFAVREDRWDRPGVAALRDLLASDEGRSILRGLGFVPTDR